MTTPLPHVFKRKRYNDYIKNAPLIEMVMRRLNQSERGELSKISQETGIPFSTIQRWQSKLKGDPHFTPLIRKYGEKRKIFTDEEENSISDYIVSNFIQTGTYFTDEDFRQIAFAAWNEKYAMNLLNGDSENVPEFQCSNGYIYDFKKNHGFSSKKFHFKRRPTFKAKHETTYFDRIVNLLVSVPKHRILNCDETGWKLFPPGILTWAETGYDNVTRDGKVEEKAQITAIATVTAANTKLPLLFVAQGKTTTVEETQIGDVGYHWKAHSESGWVNEQVFSQYLHQIRQYYDDSDKLYLILDVYPAHRNIEVINEAAALNIELIFIPAGLTDTYQPLDRRIFGILKAKARRFFRMRFSQNIDIEATKRAAAQDFVAAWESISAENVEDAWEIYHETLADISPQDDEMRKRHHRDIVALKKKNASESRRAKLQARIRAAQHN